MPTTTGQRTMPVVLRPKLRHTLARWLPAVPVFLLIAVVLLGAAVTLTLVWPTFGIAFSIWRGTYQPAVQTGPDPRCDWARAVAPLLSALGTVAATLVALF